MSVSANRVRKIASAITSFLSLDDADAKRQTNAKGSDAMAVAYHYYENQTYDKSAKDPWRPWTYSYHNFHLEHKKYRQLNSACWLRVVQ